MASDDNFCGACGAPAELGYPDGGGVASTEDGDTTSDDSAGLWAVTDADVKDAGAQDGATVMPVQRTTDVVEAGAGADTATDDPAPTRAHVVEVWVDDEPTSTTLQGDETSMMAPAAVVGAGGGVDLVTCPSCRAVNAAQRARCAQCGEALGEISTDERDWVLPDPEPQPEAEPQSRQGSRPRRAGLPTWAWVIIVGVLVGGGIGVATSFGLGPLAAEDGTGIEFRAQAYPEAPDILAPALVGGSEVREQADGRDFSAASLLDDDATTAWAPLVATDATVTFRFDAPVWISAIELANGDQFDAATFDQTGRVRLADLDMGHGQIIEATFIDGDGRQVLRLPSPVLTTQLDLEVREVTGADDVAVSEIRITGNPASPRDSADYRKLG